MVIALNPQEEVEFTPSADRLLKEEYRTTFLFRDLTEAERAEIADCAYETIEAGQASRGRIRTLQGTQTIKALRTALTGTRAEAPLRDGKGDPVPFKKDPSGQVVDAWLRLIPWEVQVEFARFIVDRTYMDAAMLGKFGLSLTSSGTGTSPDAPTSAGGKESEGEPTTEGPGEPSGADND